MQWWRRMQHGTACLMRRTRSHKLSRRALWQLSCRFGHQAHPPESEQEHVSTDFRENKTYVHFKFSCRKTVPFGMREHVRFRYHWQRYMNWCEATGWCAHFHLLLFVYEKSDVLAHAKARGDCKIVDTPRP